MSVHADSRVDEYISRLPGWQQAACQQVRRLVHAADPEVEETIKRSVRAAGGASRHHRPHQLRPEPATGEGGGTGSL
jgi:hypothetical protein